MFVVYYVSNYFSDYEKSITFCKCAQKNQGKDMSLSVHVIHVKRGRLNYTSLDSMVKKKVGQYFPTINIIKEKQVVEGNCFLQKTTDLYTGFHVFFQTSIFFICKVYFKSIFQNNLITSLKRDQLFRRYICNA